MRIISLIATVTTVFMVADVAYAVSKPRAVSRLEGRSVFESIKSVPPGATLEYRVNGQVAQSLNIPPGVYKISITQVR